VISNLSINYKIKRIKCFLHGHLLDIKRRISINILKTYNPYMTPPREVNLSSYIGHQSSLTQVKKLLTFKNENLNDIFSWQQLARNKLKELMSFVLPSDIPNEKHIEKLPLFKGVNRVRYYLSGFDGNDIPVTLLWSDNIQVHSILICLSGSASGVHLLWGEALMPSDPARLLTDADVGLQAVSNGFFAVCIEQRCFGEREERVLKPRSDARCVDAFMHSLLLGQTLLGQNSIDISTVINWLKKCELPVDVIRDDIWIYGHSSGGTIAVYSSAVDERISGTIASGCISPLSMSLLKRRNPEGHSTVPGILNWFEYHDLVCLCAPRPFIAIGGKNDHIFPYEGMKNVIKKANVIYQGLGVDNNLHTIVGDGGHRMYTHEMWTTLMKYFPEASA
jgi:alpha/beta hydrolase family protein